MRKPVNLPISKKCSGTVLLFGKCGWNFLQTLIYYGVRESILGDISKTHFTVHRCITIYFEKNENLVLNKIGFCNKKSHTFIHPVLRNKILYES